MAQQIFTKHPRVIYRKTKEIVQPFQHLLVLDFECTCKKHEKIEPQEIIEFPCVAVSTTSWETVNVFHEYIKPRVHPELTPFCTKLTGIMQNMVDEQPHFPEVFEKFCNWLEEHSYFKQGNDCAFVTCGDWDLKHMLPQQCKLDNVPLPIQFKKWINLKGTFCDSTDHFPRNLMDMLQHLKLPMHGKAHSGIDDVQNMIRIMQVLHSQHNAVFKINNAHLDVLKDYIQIT